MALLLAGLDVFPGKVVELILLVGTSTVITSWAGGRPAVRALFAGLKRWRIGAARWALVLLAMPVLTIGVAAATGTLDTPQHGWAGEVGTYVALLVLIGLTGSLWEETAWSGFVQSRLMSRHGLLVGSLLTAVPFALIHLPLAFEGGPVPAIPDRRPPGRHPGQSGAMSVVPTARSTSLPLSYSPSVSL